jgi:predicted HAD superfamily Cof-like phosphohydrolase
MYLEQVKEFMISCEQPVASNFHQLDKVRAELRLSLILEELDELSIALGTNAEFKRLIAKQLAKPIVYKEADPVEQLDAYCDLQYVLTGAVLESGLGEVFDEGFNLVHESNMTKLINNQEELEETIQHYKEQEIETYVKKDKSFPKPIYRAVDNKVLKNKNYIPVSLSPVVEAAFRKEVE